MNNHFTYFTMLNSMHNDLIGEFEEYKITKDIGLLSKQNMVVLMPRGCEGFNTQI